MTLNSKFVPMKNSVKSLFVLLLMVSASVFANNPNPSIVSQSEYDSATKFEKRVINQIDAAIAALDVLNKNSFNQDFEAIVSISENSEDKFANGILLSKKESSQLNADMVRKGSCEVSSSSAYKCIKEITKGEASGDNLEVEVKRNENGGITISW